MARLYARGFFHLVSQWDFADFWRDNGDPEVARCCFNQTMAIVFASCRKTCGARTT
jgi:hypothetical protein